MSHSISVSDGIEADEGALWLRLRLHVFDVFSLSKPGIITLLLVTTACPMVVAAGGRVSLELLCATLLGGALMSASANACNCIWDRDIDLVMKRTQGRPLPARRMSVSVACIYAAVFGILGFGILVWQVNLIAALVALFGHLFYVVIYTMWLKRSTAQNIVIGGAAGAVPPVVGWAAVSGEISTTAIALFMLIFFWTPPHFWALALNKNEDYRRAGIPMLPVVAGRMATCRQMLFYALCLLPISVILAVSNPNLSWFTLASLLSLGLIFVARIVKLFMVSEEEFAQASWSAFTFSLIYLAAVFAVMVADTLIVAPWITNL